jgi:hypothetical protein
MEKKWIFMSFSEGLKAVKDGRVDAVTLYAGMPNAGVMDITTTHDCNLIGLTKDIQQKIAKEYPYMVPMVIPANTYKGVDKDVLTLSIAGVVYAAEALSANITYRIVKTVHDNLDQLTRGHKAFKKWQFTPDVGNLIPLHEGAKKYYKELGLIK